MWSFSRAKMSVIILPNLYIWLHISDILFSDQPVVYAFYFVNYIIALLGTFVVKFCKPAILENCKERLLE